MEKKLLWFFVVALLGANVELLTRAHSEESSGAMRRLLHESEIADALTKSTYADEEEAVVLRTGSVPRRFPGLEPRAASDDGLQFFLFASVEDCTNSIEAEVVRLNEIARFGRGGPSVRAFLVDEDRPARARRLIAQLSPQPEFPVSIENAISWVPPATTPLILVVRARDGKILDAHKPIPEDLTKRDAFYTRWLARLDPTSRQEQP